MLLPKNSKNPLNVLPIFSDPEDPYPFQTYMFQVFRNLAISQAKNATSLSTQFITWIALELFNALSNANIKSKPSGTEAATCVVTISKELRDFMIQSLRNYPGNHIASSSTQEALPILNGCATESQAATDTQSSSTLNILQNFARTQVTQAECLAQEILDYICREWLHAMLSAQVRVVKGVEICDVKISKELYNLTTQVLAELKSSKRQKCELVPESRELFSELLANGITPYSSKPKEDLNLLTEREIFNTQISAQERRTEMKPKESTAQNHISRPVAPKEPAVKPEIAAKLDTAPKLDTPKTGSNSDQPTPPREKRKKIVL